MSVINKMSKKQALTALVKVAKLQEKLLKKLATDQHEEDEEHVDKCFHCGDVLPDVGWDEKDLFGEKMGLQVINGMLRMATDVAKTK